MKSIIILFLLYLPNGNQYRRKVTTTATTKAPRKTRVPVCQCRVNTHDLMKPTYPPMLLHPDEARIFYPNQREHFIVIKSGAAIDAFCTGDRGMYLGGEIVPYQKIRLTCLQGYVFATLDKEVNITDVGCVERIVSHATNTKRICGLKGLDIEVGFLLNNETFIWQYTICFNFRGQISEYSRFTLQPLVSWKRSIRRARYPKSDFFNLSRPLSVYYNDMSLINLQLGRPEHFRWFTYQQDNMKIGKFFLITQTDFYYKFEQQATKYFINIVPHFNRTPWHMIRMALRWYAWKKKVQLEIYTGTLKFLKLYNVENRTMVSVYLDSSRKKLPIPGLLWKTAYDRKNQAAIAFIAENNYFHNNIIHPMCDDVSSKLPWMTPLLNYSYACVYQDLANIVRYSLPRLPETKLLMENFEVPESLFEFQAKKF